ncbi:MAG TPA: circularly permuted type 2 ATP-grasp protein [Marinagarivorans sp.]
MVEFIYKPRPNLVDEAFDADGKAKPHWQYLLDSLSAMGADAFADRQNKAQRILRDDGATYNIYSEQNTPDHAWKLDLVPSLITSEDWGKIEGGLLERSELFNLFLKDIYGSRDLIRTGVIPPEALFLHRGFLRPCQGVSVPGEHQLLLHSVDLVRATDGKLSVLTDRTQSPSGAGYALENRTVMSRVLPSMFRDSHVHRLAQFFQKLRTKLTSLSINQDQPRVVVLTPGTHNEAYFEHAYLANYLGFHLVQSGDLIVRNGHVWMKSLDGLSRVDVILRRVDDSYCDPVELRGDSQLGVPNLLEVVRAGRVVIANPLGSGILENPIFLKYLPAISQALLGRELRLPSVATYWLGDDHDYSKIKHSFDDWVIKPIYRGDMQKSALVSQLSKAERTEFLAKVQAKPELFVAQPAINTTHLPSFSGGQLVPRPAIMRSFSVATEKSYTVMPGGLTRVGTGERAFVISNQAGAFSKDTWVIASEPERIASAGGGEQPTPMREADLISLPSRVVENLFWMGRYAERAEALLRLLRTVFVLLNGEEPISMVCRRQLLTCVTEMTSMLPGFKDAPAALINNPGDELIAAVADGARMGSVRSNLNAMLYCSDESKELLSSDTLRVINDIRDALYALDSDLAGGLASAPEEALDPLVTALMALSGLSQESMLRGVGWRFMQIGRRLERTVQTAAIIDNLIVLEVGEQDQSTLIQALLQTLENLISYRRRYRARMGVQSSLDLVMLDTSNPRSLLFQLEELGKHLRALPKVPETRHELALEERAALEAETLIKLSLLKELSSRDDGQRKILKQNLEQLTELMAAVSSHVSDKYFDHKNSSQQLVRNAIGE